MSSGPAGERSRKALWLMYLNAPYRPAPAHLTGTAMCSEFVRGKKMWSEFAWFSEWMSINTVTLEMTYHSRTIFRVQQ